MRAVVMRSHLHWKWSHSPQGFAPSTGKHSLPLALYQMQARKAAGAGRGVILPWNKVSAEVSVGELFRLSLWCRQNFPGPKGLLRFPTGYTTFEKCRSAACLLRDVCLLKTQMAAFREAFRMQLSKIYLGCRSPFSLFLLPCAIFWPSWVKSANEDNLLSCFDHIEVKTPNQCLLNLKNGRERRIWGLWCLLSKPGQHGELQLSCPCGIGWDFRLMVVVVEINIYTYTHRVSAYMAMAQ